MRARSHPTLTKRKKKIRGRVGPCSRPNACKRRELRVGRKTVSGRVQNFSGTPAVARVTVGKCVVSNTTGQRVMKPRVKICGICSVVRYGGVLASASKPRAQIAPKPEPVVACVEEGCDLPAENWSKSFRFANRSRCASSNSGSTFSQNARTRFESPKNVSGLLRLYRHVLSHSWRPRGSHYCCKCPH
jgi:hypothetical protein